MAAFDKINAALSGQKAQPSGATRKPTSTGDFGGVDVKAREMCAAGMSPSDYGINYSCGMDRAVSEHADKVHPVGPAPKLRSGGGY